ncbi:MAG: EamA family transporter, partial [Candidatus Dadabacteria bacterium]|nr:EamA family transporter [Candidatus Dadabacteria bacterium]
MSSNHWKVILLIFTIITWGYSWILMKQSLQYMEPFTFIALRHVVAAVVLLPFMFFHSSFKLKNFSNPHFFLIGLIQTAAMMAFIIYGMKFVT